MYTLVNPDEIFEHKNGYEEFITSHTTDQKQYKVSGKPIKIKGYKGFEFFVHKFAVKVFHVREKRTGMKIATGESMPIAKKNAKIELDAQTAMNNIKLSHIIDERLKEIKG